MPTPRGVLWPRDPHTGAKHDLLRHYLSAWLPVLLQTFGRATYAEGFAGPGIYLGGEPGSPVIALDVVDSHRRLFHGRQQLDLLFVEEDERRHERLISEINNAVSRMGGLPPGVVIRPPRRGDCAQALPALLDDANAWGVPMFIALDSFGGPDVPHSLLRRIAGNKAGEVLVSRV
jgi:three-Cys-motif partner protein